LFIHTSRASGRSVDCVKQLALQRFVYGNPAAISGEEQRQQQAMTDNYPIYRQIKMENVSYYA